MNTSDLDRLRGLRDPTSTPPDVASLPDRDSGRSVSHRMLVTGAVIVLVALVAAAAAMAGRGGDSVEEVAGEPPGRAPAAGPSSSGSAPNPDDATIGPLPARCGAQLRAAIDSGLETSVDFDDLGGFKGLREAQPSGGPVATVAITNTGPDELVLSTNEAVALAAIDEQGRLATRPYSGGLLLSRLTTIGPGQTITVPAYLGAVLCPDSQIPIDAASVNVVPVVLVADADEVRALAGRPVTIALP